MLVKNKYKYDLQSSNSHYYNITRIWSPIELLVAVKAKKWVWQTVFRIELYTDIPLSMVHCGDLGMR